VADAEGTALLDLGLAPLLESRGIVLLPGLVLDPSQATLLNPGTSFYADRYDDSVAVRPLAERKIPVVFSRARAVKIGKSKTGVSVTRLVSSSADAWAETELNNDAAPEASKGEARGPLLLGLTVEQTTQGKAARLAVVADSDFAANWMLGTAGNLDLLLGLVHWLADKQQQIAIAPKSPEEIRIALSGGQMASLFWVTVIAMPLLAVVLGGAVFWIRRK